MQARAPQRPKTNIQKSQSAPVGGLNVVSALQGMPQNDAFELTNWIAQQYGVRSRKGFSEWAINLSGEVRTIMEYAPDRNNVSARKLFAATDNNIYDVTTSTNAPPVSLALPGTDQFGRFTNTMFANAAGTFLLITSNQGGYKYFNGAAWATPTLGGGAGQVTPVDPANLIYVQPWKHRNWFIEKGTTKVWYSDIDSITGTFHPLDIGPSLEHGGVLSFIGRWSIDAGEGVDDFLVIGGEKGDIVIYKGTDPSSASTFGLVGVWYIGSLPIGHRTSVQYGGDLLVFGATGIQPVSYITRGGQSLLRSSSVDYLRKIQPRLGDLLITTSTQLGWEMIMSLEENLLIVLTPPNNTTAYDQYALYTNANTWCKFTGMSMATAFSSETGVFYGTTTGKVIKALSGYFDNVAYGDTVGNGIAGIIQTSYQYFGYPGMYKQWHLVRPTFIAADRPAVSIDIVADYQQSILPTAPVYAVSAGSKWDISRWDINVWGGGLNTYQDWYGATGLGYVGSAYLNTVCVGDTFLVSIDHVFEDGGAL